MTKRQETFNKKEREKKRVQKKKDKEQRKEERKANTKEGQTLEDQLAYVDEDGNISSTPPDPTKKRIVKVEDMITGSRNNEAQNSLLIRKGKVTFFNTSKGYGFIKDTQSGQSIFVHNNALLTPIKENDIVTFETIKDLKGVSAIKVKVIR